MHEQKLPPVKTFMLPQLAVGNYSRFLPDIHSGTARFTLGIIYLSSTDTVKAAGPSIYFFEESDFSAMTGESAIAASIDQQIWHWIVRLGAIGFIPLGLVDASVVPVPGSMDILLVLLAARQKQLWPFYALAATLGAVIGGYVTYRLARKGGQETLEKKVKPDMLKRAQRWFAHSGFAAVAVPALLPPPIPMVPFLMAAGAAQYPRKKFVLALTVGRLARYLVLGFLGAHYGRQIVSWLSELGHPLPITVMVFVMVATGLWFFLRYRRAHRKPA